MSMLLALAVTAALTAQTEPRRQPTIVVTASRREQLTADALAAITVIDRDAIVATGASDISDVLSRVAGIDIARTGGSGQSTSVFMRGTNSNHVLILIDGMRVASANTGTYAWEHLPLSQVERIEIVRGPRAAYWGSDAIGGVIAITTRKVTGPAARVSAGRWNRRGLEAAIGAGEADAGWSLSAGSERYDGFSAQGPDGFSFDPDDDGYDRDALAMRGNYTLGAQRLAFTGLATDASVEFDRGVSDSAQHALSARMEGPLADNWTHELVVGSARDRLETAAFAQYFDTRRNQADWIHRVALGDHDDLVFGANWLRERGGNFNLGDGTPNYASTRTNRALFASIAGNRDAVDHELSVRHDRNSAFGSTTTGQAAAAVPLAGGRAYASFGQGFRAPNFNELYSPGFGGFFAGNPALDAERSRSAEIGYAAELGAWNLAVRGFATRVNDLIAFAAPDTSNAINVARARIDGVELEWAWQDADWHVRGTATWQDPEDAATGLALLRRPQRKATLGVERSFGQSIAAIDVLHASERREFGGPLAAYTIVDLRWSIELGAGFAAAAVLSNAGNRQYVLARGFNTPERALGVSISWSTP